MRATSALTVSRSTPAPTSRPGPGRPGYPPLVLFKALLLQAMYGLSDPAPEEALVDRLSFRRFVGLALEDAVPDHSTLCRFRNRLRADMARKGSQSRPW